MLHPIILVGPFNIVCVPCCPAGYKVLRLRVVSDHDPPAIPCAPAFYHSHTHPPLRHTGYRAIPNSGCGGCGVRARRARTPHARGRVCARAVRACAYSRVHARKYVLPVFVMGEEGGEQTRGVTQPTNPPRGVRNGILRRECFPVAPKASMHLSEGGGVVEWFSGHFQTTTTPPIFGGGVVVPAHSPPPPPRFPRMGYFPRCFVEGGGGRVVFRPSWHRFFKKSVKIARAARKIFRGILKIHKIPRGARKSSEVFLKKIPKRSSRGARKVFRGIFKRIPNKLSV